MQRRQKILAALLAVGSALPAAASTFVAMDTKDLVAASDTVVRGKVVSVESFWNDPHTLIVTEAVFEVETPLVGAAPRYVTLRTAGGSVDGFTVEAHGFPVFHAGERALLFLARDDKKPLGKVYPKGRPAGYRVAGYQLGHYRVVSDHGEEIAVPTADPALRLVGPRGKAIAAPRVWHLADFEQEIRQLGQQLGRTAGAPGPSPRR